MQIRLSEHFSYKKLITFTLPSIVMMVFTSIYGIVDGIFVSKLVGQSAFVAVNLVMPLLMALGAFGFMLGTGGSALLAKTLGEGNKEKASKLFTMLIAVIVAVGLLITVLGIIFINPICDLLDAEGEIRDYCITYGRIIFAAFTPFLLQNAFQSYLVVAEKPKLGLYISLAVGCLNMIGDFVLIYFCKMGIMGAALATAISQIIGGILPIFIFIFKKDLPFKFEKFRFAWRDLLKCCANGSSEMMSNFSMSLVNMLFNSQLLKLYGKEGDGVAAFGVIMYVSFIFIATFIGYSIGSAPIIGYHFGAKNKSELNSVFRKSLVIVGILVVSLTGIAEAVAGVFAGIFTNGDIELKQLTQMAMRLYSISFLLCGFNIFFSAFFTALNNGFLSALLSFVRTLIFQIIMIYLLPALFGADAIWLSVLVAEAFSFILGVILIKISAKKYGYSLSLKAKKAT